jgi:hypothetical protein
MNEHPQPHDDGLSPAARVALAALRAEDDLAAAVRDRMWSRLAAAADEDVPSDMSQEPAPPRRLGRGVLLGLAIAAGLTLTLIGLQRGAQPVAVAPRAGAAAYGGSGATERAARASGRGDGSSTDAGSQAVGGASAVAVPEDRSDPADSGAPRSEPTPRRKAADRGAVPGDMSRTPGTPGAAGTPDAAGTPGDVASSPGGSALGAEAALLQRAQTALATGAPAAALLQLEQHAREFPAGVLAPERAALRVVALCAAGREAEGRAEAASFLRAHAGSVLAERVRGACDGG